MKKRIGTIRWRKIKMIIVLARVIVGPLLMVLCAVGTVSAEDDRNARGGHYTYGDAQLMLNSYPPIHGPGDRTTSGLDIRPFPGTRFETYRYCVDDWHVVAYRTGEQTVLGPFNPVKTDCLDCPSCEDCIKEAWYPWDQAFDPYDPDPDDPLVPFKPENDFVSTKPREALIELGRLDAVFELDGKEIQVLRTSVNKLFTDEEHESDIIKAKEACYERFNLTCDFRVKTYAFQWGKIYPPGELAVGVHTLRMVETYYAENGDEFIFSDSTLTFTVYEHDEACHGEPCEPL